MTQKTHLNYYSTPEDFPIPEGTDPVDALIITLDRAEGILSLLIDNSENLNGKATWAALGMIRQSQALVNYWNEMDMDK